MTIELNEEDVPINILDGLTRKISEYMSYKDNIINKIFTYTDKNFTYLAYFLINDKNELEELLFKTNDLVIDYSKNIKKFLTFLKF